MEKRRDLRGVGIFTLVAFLYSWPIMFVVDAWLVPMFSRQNDIAATELTLMFGHMLAMLGPALAAILLWRLYHKEPLPPWKWSQPQYYVLVVLATVAYWGIPALLGLAFGDAFRLRRPIESFAWVIIGANFTLAWVAGLGEEVGWIAYLLPRLEPHVGKLWSLAVSGVIRGLWHWPVVASPFVVQVISGEMTIGLFVVRSLVIAFQLAWSNIFFGAIFGAVWYRTKSVPLLGWLHQWCDAARDVTAVLVVGYASGLWATMLSGVSYALIAYLLLKPVLPTRQMAGVKIAQDTSE
jgi:membrane protease YdiL (CAAX protease family)